MITLPAVLRVLPEAKTILADGRDAEWRPIAHVDIQDFVAPSKIAKGNDIHPWEFARAFTAELARRWNAHADLVRDLEVLLRCMEDAADGAFANGNTDERGSIDEGEVLTRSCMDRARKLIASLRGEPVEPSSPF